MRVFILGAGASFHAGYPLAASMGEKLAIWVETLAPDHPFRNLIQQLKDRYGDLGNFEAVLENLMVSSSEKTDEVRLDFESCKPYLLSELQEALRTYFDVIRLSPTSLYDQLAEEVQAGDVIITFNYDMGIEHSLRQAGKWLINDGYGFSMEDCSEHSPVKIFKLHGSTNWRALQFRGKGTGGIIRQGDSLGNRPVLFFRSDLKYLLYDNYEDPLCRGITEAASVALMILPALPKRFYFDTSFGRELESFWQQLWDEAGTALSCASEIIVIGYSLPIADVAARKLILAGSNPKATICICCGSSSSMIAKEFRDHGLSTLRTIPETFAEYLHREQEKGTE